MATMDVFNSNAFSLTSLSGSVDKIPYKPAMLGELGIFDPMPVRNRTIFVDQRDGALNLISDSPNGAAPEELERDDRTAIPLKALRLAKGATINAAEIASWRAFGTESEQTVAMQEYARRSARLRQDMEATHELHRLGAVQGILLDASGATKYNYFTEFGIAEAAAIDFAFSSATTEIRTVCHTVTRAIARASKGAVTSSTKIHALAGDEFYDTLISHATVKNTYLNWAAAADLRDNKSFGAFEFGGITWHNYRGTDDNSTIAVPTSTAKFFPVGGTDVFKQAMAPMDESLDYVGTPGQNIYSMMVRDTTGRNFWVRNELYSYPLFFCQRPDVLRKATMS